MKQMARTLCAILLMSCFGFAGSRAGWIENGVPLTRQWGAEEAGVIASDGSSGAIIAYKTCHEGVGHIIAQRVNSLGVVLWGEEGIEVCAATGNQESPRIASDGAGGAIIIWRDYRSGSWDIYAQRVNASGSVQWAANGVAICTATGYQLYPAITSDGAGGAIVTWLDSRGSSWDIYAQRMNASGAVQWTANGVALCAATGNMEYGYPTITSDGAGGAIVTWDDHRSGSNFDIYAQRVNASGSVQWTANGVAICAAPGDQNYPQIISDGAGGAIVTWYDNRSGNRDIYTQQVNTSGAVQWTADGVALCAALGEQEYPQIASDGAGGAIITWQDARYGSGYYDIYTQRVDASGAVRWTTDGVPLCGYTGNQQYPAIAYDGAGGAIVTWLDNRSSSWDVYAQKVNASGSVQWKGGGVALCTAKERQASPTIAFDGAGGAIVTWLDSRNGNYSNYTQRVNALGSVQWTANGVALGTAWGDQRSPAIISDDAGGAIVAWSDERSGSTDLYAQRVNASGTSQWAANGVVFITAPSNITMTSDGAGGAIITWQVSHYSTWDIYAQRVNASGEVQWTANGVALCTAAGDQTLPQITSDGAGGAIIAWRDHRNGSSYEIYAQRVNASGEVQWTANGVAIGTTTTQEEGSFRITSDDMGGAIVTWQDYRSGSNYDIYAQRVDASGSVQWTADGVDLCTLTSQQQYPVITSDDAGGAIVAWQDFRSGNADIYAQRMSASGAVLWAANGVAICTAPRDQNRPGIVSDGAGGAIVLRWDFPLYGPSYVYVQRVNALGAVQWTVDGVALSTVGEQYYPAMTSDGAGGAIITWQDSRKKSWDIYAQRVNASGAIQWTTSAAAICTAPGGGTSPRVISDGSGGGIIAWQDGRCGAHIYAQRIRASGQIVATTLQNYSAALEGASIRIGWSLFEIDTSARFSIFRGSAPDWEYVELESANINKDRLSFTFTDEACHPGSTYKYRVDCAVEGAARRILFETDAIAIPAIPVTLYQNHPNPFNPQTVIRFYLPQDQEIFLDVYDVAGRRVARLAEGKTEKGYHEVTWDGRNSSGIGCSSGVYFSRLKAGKSTISRKIVIMR
jgi:hypothetical protein